MRAGVNRPRYFGRRRELERFAALVRAARGGTAGWLSVTAEPGFGKSEFLAQACRTVEGETSGTRVIQSRAYETVRLPPYAVLEPVVREMWQRVAEAQRPIPPALVDVSLGLTAFAPYLVAEDRVERFESLDMGRREQAVNAFMAELISATCGDAALLIAIDDFHRADEQSIRVLGRLFLDWASLPLAILTTRRPASAAPNATVDAVLNDLSRHDRFLEETLPPLSHSDARRLARAMGAGSDRVEEVAEQSDGHPLLLRWIAAGTGASETVARFVRAATSDLTGRELTALMLLAIFGRDFSVHSMTTITELPETVCSNLISRCVDLMLLRRATDGMCRFFHSLVRDELLAGVTQEQLGALHAAVAHHIAELTVVDEGTRDLDLSYHLLRSSAASDRDTGIRHGLKAAGRAESAGAWEDALAIWRDVERHASDNDALLRADIDFGIARCLLYKPIDYPARYGGQALLNSAIRAFVDLQAFDRLVAAASERSYHVEFDLIDVWEHAVRICPADYPGASVLQARVTWNRMYVWRTVEELEEALGRLRRLIRPDDPEWVPLFADVIAALLRYVRGDYDGAVRDFEPLAQRARGCSDPFLRIVVPKCYSSALRKIGSLDQAETHAWESYREAVGARGIDVNMVTLAQGLLQRSALGRGDWAQVLEHGDVESTTTVWSRLCVYYYTGRTEEGDTVLAGMIAGLTNDPVHWVPLASFCNNAVALRAWCTGEDRFVAEADGWSRDLIAFQEINPIIRTRILAGYARTAFLCGYTGGLAAVAEELNATKDHNLERHLLLRTLAICAWGRGRLVEARRRFEEALEWCDFFHDLPLKAWTHFDLFRVSREQDAESQSKRYKDRAAGMAARLGMTALTRRLEETSAAENPRRMLTERELEILKLLSEGLADKEIAGRLGLSTYTATNHVRHIRAKLNCATRAEAVAAALRLGISE